LVSPDELKDQPGYMEPLSEDLIVDEEKFK